MHGRDWFRLSLVTTEAGDPGSCFDRLMAAPRRCELSPHLAPNGFQLFRRRDGSKDKGKEVSHLLDREAGE